ncbi:MAG: DotU family type IV/VI secretion system protein, partial [Planctomycetes bacterium]|nr:DotU family type IV/VI secretion system protein [Planctomycetota bacterium]
IRFALTCWLDERLPSGWIPSADGWAKFWDEARYAETRSDLDALETMYLCVMLGFRGSWRHEAAQLASWEARVRARLAARASTWTMPAGLDSPRLERVDRDVPSRLTYVALLIGALLVPLVAALLWQIRA